MNALPRWLTSITDMPLPFQSSSSSRACSSTSVGSAAGTGREIEGPHPGRRLKDSEPARSGSARLAGRRRPRPARSASAPRIAFGGKPGDALEPGELIPLLEADEAHALGIAADHRDVLDRRAHQGAVLAHEHDLIVETHLQRSDHAAVAVGDLQRDHALAAAAVRRETPRAA